MIFSHVLYRLSYLGIYVCNRPYCNELGSPSVEDGASEDTVDPSFLATNLQLFPVFSCRCSYCLNMEVLC